MTAKVLHPLEVNKIHFEEMFEHLKRAGPDFNDFLNHYKRNAKKWFDICGICSCFNRIESICTATNRTMTKKSYCFVDDINNKIVMVKIA